MKHTKTPIASRKVNGIIPVDMILKNQRTFHQDIAHNLNHWVSNIMMHGQFIANHMDSGDNETETSVLKILDACMNLSSFHKIIFSGDHYGSY